MRVRCRLDYEKIVPILKEVGYNGWCSIVRACCAPRSAATKTAFCTGFVSAQGCQTESAHETHSQNQVYEGQDDLDAIPAMRKAVPYLRSVLAKHKM